MGREFELKFRTEEAGFAAIRQAFSNWQTIEMETTYFDTPDRALGSRKWMLRRRKENGVFVCTLKTPLPDGSRGEWETECENIRLAVEKLSHLQGSRELWKLVHTGLREVCGARFTRLCTQIPLEDGTVELALDRGQLFGGRKSCGLLEVEVELKAGSDAVAREFAGKLAAQYHLVPESRSKYARALALTEEKQE